MASRRNHRPFRSLGMVAAAALVVVGCSRQDDLAERQATVASRGAQVMPFDLEQTTHTFTKTPSGGLQVVSADDAANQSQIDLIREHLRVERDNFAAGNFEDPARIHGMDMPGVSELSAGYADITVTYAERADGAELTYSTDAPALIDAIHAWFDRQVMDHGSHATSG